MHCKKNGAEQNTDFSSAARVEVLGAAAPMLVVLIVTVACAVRLRQEVGKGAGRQDA